MGILQMLTARGKWELDYDGGLSKLNPEKITLAARPKEGLGLQINRSTSQTLPAKQTRVRINSSKIM